MCAVLYRASDDIAGTNAGVHFAGAKDFFLVLPLAKFLTQLEHSTRCVLGMLSIGIRKSENSNYSFSIGSVYVSSSFDQTIGGLANEFRHRFRVPRGIRRPGEASPIGYVADHDASFVQFRLTIERAVADTTKFFVRKAIGKHSSYQVRSVSPEESSPCFSSGHCVCNRKYAGNRLEKNAVKRTNPRKHKELDR